MDDDLNISKVMASLFKSVKQINILIQNRQMDADDASRILEIFDGIDHVLQIFDFKDKYSDTKIQQLVAQREKARGDKNWALADDLRDQLMAMGVSIQDDKVDEAT